MRDYHTEVKFWETVDTMRRKMEEAEKIMEDAHDNYRYQNDIYDSLPEDCPEEDLLTCERNLDKAEAEAQDAEDIFDSLKLIYEGLRKMQDHVEFLSYMNII